MNEEKTLEEKIIEELQKTTVWVESRGRVSITGLIDIKKLKKIINESEKIV